MFGGYEAVHEAIRSHLNDDDEMFGVFQISGSVFCVRAFTSSSNSCVQCSRRRITGCTPCLHGAIHDHDCCDVAHRSKTIREKTKTPSNSRLVDDDNRSLQVPPCISYPVFRGKVCTKRSFQGFFCLSSCSREAATQLSANGIAHSDQYSEMATLLSKQTREKVSVKKNQQKVLTLSRFETSLSVFQGCAS
jgi:hypothetical protein